MQATIDQQTQEKIRQVSEETGIPEPEVLHRALDMLLLTEEMHGLRELKDDIDFWQERYFDTLVLDISFAPYAARGRILSSSS
jgi:hypothetical protein